MRELSYGITLVFSKVLPDEALEHNPLFLGQALYFVLEESNHRMRHEPELSGRFSVDRLRRIANWVREAMDHCQRENVFRELFAYYSYALASNSSEEVRRHLDERLEPRIRRGIEQRLAHFRGQTGITLHSPEELVMLGTILGEHQEDTSLGMLRYAMENGLIQTGDLESIPLEPASLEEFHLRSERMGILDIGTLTKGQILTLLRRHRAFDEPVRQAAYDFGETHPLVIGWSSGFFSGTHIETRRSRMEELAQTIEAYLAERH